MLSALLMQRKLVNKYEKHNLLKIYSYYFLLKAITTSGTVHNFSDQKPFLRKYFKVTRNTFTKIISQLVELNLVTITNDDLNIAEWKQADAILQSDYSTNFYSLTYSTTDKQTLYYLMFAIDILENQSKQRNAIQKKLGLNSPQLVAIKNSLSALTNISLEEINQLSFDNFCELLKVWQQKCFAMRTVHFSVLHQIRIDTNRSLKSLRLDWFLKDFRTATYIKRKLEELKIICNEKQQIIFSDNGNRMLQISKQYCDIYSSVSKMRGYRFTDQLNVKVEISMP